MNKDKNLCVSVYICGSFSFISLFCAMVCVSTNQFIFIPVREDTNRGDGLLQCYLTTDEKDEHG
ncbi:hypothetical protein ACUN24_21995 [Pedobacter sp. WC2501]|uniref:hypothetical protein n=1 Tax=Pedobacter sp. WC2501 TaxID=3461400 RepID=UPI0040464BCB